jgi:uncharacterized protein (TIGR02147 family)
MEALKLAPRPNIFEYTDYRKFLEDIYHFLKSSHRGFSFRYFSQRAGFASPNFLKLVIESKRNLSDDSIARFAQALKLNRTESDFFAHLVHFTQAKNASEKAESAQAMMRAKSFLKIHPLQQAEYAYYACWYYIPVRELVSLESFQESPEWIAARLRPKISSEEAAKALRDLEALGMLVRDANGRLKQSIRTVTTSSEVSSSAIVRYHKEMMSLASKSIDNVPKPNREISAACVPVSKATAHKLKAMIQEFRQELLAIAEEDQAPAETVYQINLQLFPLSDWEGEK